MSATLFESPLTLALYDAYPVSPGHALIIPRRHVATWFDATDDERRDLTAAIEHVRNHIEQTHRPDGYNIGINVGEAAGQTVFHLHVHVIPRYRGDVPDPRGGVRHVIPGRGNYLANAEEDRVADSQDAAKRYTPSRPQRSLVTGGTSDSLLPQLLAAFDEADAVSLAVAFVMQSGLDLLEDHILDLLERGGSLRLLTGDYLGGTDPVALRRLLDLARQGPEHVELRAFESAGTSFHPKAYLARRGAGGVAFIGSSNVSAIALRRGVEWNWRIVDGADLNEVAEEFDRLFRHPRTAALTDEWITAYEARRPQLSREQPKNDRAEVEPEIVPPPQPNSVQVEALAALDKTRADGNRAGLVVLGTGLGKTWLAAFDSASFKRVLFVAHREEILQQTMRTFRRIRPQARLGLFMGQERAFDCDVVLASVQTLSRQSHLDRFSTDAFDYIVIDEFHHACANSYARLIRHFRPAFLLGLTATPERTDGGDLLALCGENLVYRCDFPEGIRRELLAPFDYWGVPDNVDYSNIPWRSGRFDELALETSLASEARAANALEHYRKHGAVRTLAFCCSKRHANFMREYFGSRGVRVAAVHSDVATSDVRSQSLERLAAGELDVVFAVDMFNEGVDVPELDAVMMLRPTLSRILWLQQFGRGLRLRPGKRLQVIDYVGNHRSFLIGIRALLGLGEGDETVARALAALGTGDTVRGLPAAGLPESCSVTYELEAVDILRSLLRKPAAGNALAAYYEDFRERNGRRPTATEALHDGLRPSVAAERWGSWFGLVRAMGDLHPLESDLLNADEPRAFLAILEKTPMEKSYKMLVLSALLDADAFPGGMSVDAITDAVAEMAARSAAVRADLSVRAGERAKLRALLVKMPLSVWSAAKGTGGRAYFRLEGDGFESTLNVIDATHREAFATMVREIVEWRLARYFLRIPPSEAEMPVGEATIVCRVSHNQKNPIVFLDRRGAGAAVPTGEHPVRIDGETYIAKFAKIAVNLVRRPDETRNVMPEILRRWFGPSAGATGREHFVEIVVTDNAVELRPQTHQKELDQESNS